MTIAVYGSNFDYGQSPLYKDDGPAQGRCDVAVAFWVKNDGSTVGTLVNAIPNSANCIQINGPTLTVDFIKSGSDPIYSLQLPDTDWHFILLQYDVTQEAVFASIDLAASINIFSSEPGYLTTLFDDAIIFMSYCPSAICDFRIFKPASTTILQPTDFTYVYNDMLAGGSRTLPQLS